MHDLQSLLQAIQTALTRASVSPFAVSLLAQLESLYVQGKLIASTAQTTIIQVIESRTAPTTPANHIDVLLSLIDIELELLSRGAGSSLQFDHHIELTGKSNHEPLSALSEAIAELTVSSSDSVAQSESEAIRNVVYQLLLDNAQQFMLVGSTEQEASPNPELQFLESENFEMRSPKNIHTASFQPPLITTEATEADLKFIESSGFMEIYETQFVDGAVTASDSLVNEMVQVLGQDSLVLPSSFVDLSSLYACSAPDSVNTTTTDILGAVFAAQPFKHNNYAITPSSTEATYRKSSPSESAAISQITNSLFSGNQDEIDGFAAFVEANAQVDALYGSVGPSAADGFLAGDYQVGLNQEEVSAGDGLSAYLNSQKNVKQSKQQKQSIFASNNKQARPISFTVTESHTMARSVFDMYEQQQTSPSEHQELLGMEVEYFFDEAEITGAPLAKKSIYETAALQPSHSSLTKNKSSIESISNAIVVNARETQWDNAAKGKKTPTPKSVKEATRRRRVGQLDSKLAGKSFVYENMEGGDGKSAVDAEVDAMLKEGVGKLRAKL
ncbi:UNVERIFIED_CONTAM: hypothetical protein HDU68_009019 [Siphonaria sp. JEL0065]|nr:hypothetical protein HDU68_009019 [Siphonaria sp. JEL0065]